MRLAKARHSQEKGNTTKTVSFMTPIVYNLASYLLDYSEFTYRLELRLRAMFA